MTGAPVPSITTAAGLPHASVYRTDRAELTTIGVGTGRYRARLARTGRQEYDTGPEHRDASEVFAAESIATLLNLRVQVGHVPNPGTSVGRVVMPFRRVDIDGRSYLEAELEIDDGLTRGRIDSGSLRDISMGYSSELVSGPLGMHQRNIRYDHCALLDTTQLPRCGEHCRVHLDQFSQPERSSSSVSSCSCDSFSDPRFPGKSRAYVEAFVALASRSDAERTARGLPPAFADVLGATAPVPVASPVSSAHSDATIPVRTSSCGMVTQRRDGTVHVDDSFFEGTGLSQADIDQQIRLAVPSTRPSLDEIADAALRVRLTALARADADAEAGNPRRDGYHEDGLAIYDSGDSASFSAHLARRARAMYGGGQ